MPSNISITTLNCLMTKTETYWNNMKQPYFFDNGHYNIFVAPHLVQKERDRFPLIIIDFSAKKTWFLSKHIRTRNIDLPRKRCPRIQSFSICIYIYICINVRSISVYRVSRQAKKSCKKNDLQAQGCAKKSQASG